MRVVAPLAMVFVAACSFAVVNGPRSTPGRYLDCTTSRAVPIVDLVAGATFVAAGIAVAYADRELQDDDKTGALTYGVTLPAIALGVVLLVSSQYGTSRVTRCRQARAADRRWTAP